MPDDHLAVSNLLSLYPERFDSGDFEGFAALFERGTWFMTALDGPGAEPVRRWCEENILVYDGKPRTKHVITNQWLELDTGAGAATARSYVTVFQGLPDFPIQPIFLGSYHDRLERIDGRWWFRDRTVMPDLMGDLSRHMRSAP